MKTQPIGLDYLLPVWVARVAQVLGAAALLAVGYLIVDLLRATPEKWPSALRLVILGGACFVVIQRARTVIPRLRDDRFQARIKKFKALKKKSWDEMLDQLVADRDVELLDESAAVMAKSADLGTQAADYHGTRQRSVCRDLGVEWPSGRHSARAYHRSVKRPNQTPEPTTLLVMPRAGARVTPSRVVAHL